MLADCALLLLLLLLLLLYADVDALFRFTIGNIDWVFEPRHVT